MGLWGAASRARRMASRTRLASSAESRSHSTIISPARRSRTPSIISEGRPSEKRRALALGSGLPVPEPAGSEDSSFGSSYGSSNVVSPESPSAGWRVGFRLSVHVVPPAEAFTTGTSFRVSVKRLRLSLMRSDRRDPFARRRSSRSRKPSPSSQARAMRTARPVRPRSSAISACDGQQTPFASLYVATTIRTVFGSLGIPRRRRTRRIMPMTEASFMADPRLRLRHRLGRARCGR